MLSMIYFATLFAFALMARSISSFPSTDRHGKMPRSWYNDNDMGPIMKLIQRDGPYESSTSPQSNGDEQTAPAPQGGSVGIGANLTGGVNAAAVAQASAAAKAAANLAGQAGGVVAGIGQAGAGLHAGANAAGSAAAVLQTAPGAGVGAAATHGSP